MRDQVAEPGPALRCLTFPQASKMTTLSVRGLWAQVAAGNLRTVRLSPKRVAILERDLAAFLESRLEGGAR